MKKFRYISILSLICIVLVGILTVNAQTIKENNEVGYTEKSIYDQKEDGWIYSFEIIYVKKDKSVNYIFDGYNLKYKESDDYYVSYKDAETGTEIDRIPSKFATLSTSGEYRDEIKEINKYFNEKKYSKTITINDLSELNITKISKEYLVDIFNRSITSDTKIKPGKYINASSLERITKKSTDENLSGEWQVMYLIDYGEIVNVDIEFISEDGEFLSDKANKDKALISDRNMNNNINKIEDEIIASQKANPSSDTNFKINSESTIQTMDDNYDLNELLKEFNTKISENNVID